MINSPKLISALAKYTRMLNRNWDVKWSPEQQIRKMKEIAIVANLTTTDLLKQEKALQDHLLTGKQYRSNGAHHKAATALGRAFIRDPSNSNIIKLLTDSSYRYWKQNQDPETLFAMSLLAEVLLLQSPSDPQALSIRALSVSRRQQQSSYYPIFWAATLALLIGGYIAWQQIKPKQQQIITPETTPELNEKQSTQDLGPLMPKPKIFLGDGAPEGIKIIDQSSLFQYSDYEKNFSYYLGMEIHNMSQYEINEIDAKMELITSLNAKIYEREIKLVPIFNGPLRPGDITNFYVFVNQDQLPINYKHPAKTVIHFTNVDSQKSPTSYPAKEKIRHSFTTKPTTQLKIEAFIRDKTKTKLTSDFWRHSVEVHNTSAVAVHSMKLRLDYYGRKQVLLGSDIQNLTIMRGDALPPKQHRVVAFSKNLSEKLYKVKLTVMEYQ